MTAQNVQLAQQCLIALTLAAQQNQCLRNICDQALQRVVQLFGPRRAADQSAAIAHHAVHLGIGHHRNACANNVMHRQQSFAHQVDLHFLRLRLSQVRQRQRQHFVKCFPRLVSSIQFHFQKGVAQCRQRASQPLCRCFTGFFRARLQGLECVCQLPQSGREIRGPRQQRRHHLRTCLLPGFFLGNRLRQISGQPGSGHLRAGPRQIQTVIGIRQQLHCRQFLRKRRAQLLCNLRCPAFDHLPQAYALRDGQQPMLWRSVLRKNQRQQMRAPLRHGRVVRLLGQHLGRDQCRQSGPPLCRRRGRAGKCR